MKRFYDMFKTLYVRIQNMALRWWRHRPRKLGQSPPFRRARVSMGMTLETASLSLTLPVETIENIECGRYRSTGLHPDFLIRVIKDYGSLLNIETEDIEAQIYNIKCASDALMPSPGRGLYVPTHHPWRTQFAMLVTSVVLSYVIFMGGWGLFCERECRCMALSYLNTLPTLMPEDALTVAHSARGQKCSIHGGCSHDDEGTPLMPAISDEAMSIVQTDQGQSTVEATKTTPVTVAVQSRRVSLNKPSRKKPSQMTLDNLLARAHPKTAQQGRSPQEDDG